MKGDFSRSSFDPQKHYQAVRMQQGRMQLDADWNEQADILLHLIRTQLNDFLGPGATAASEPGFAITLTEPAEESADPVEAGQPEEPVASAKTLPDFQIGAGRYYVEGMLCENETPVLFSRQPDYPDAESLLRKPVDADHFLVYLDVWQRHITAVQDPTIREIALGGPDTATRVKTVWQVKLLPLSGDPTDDQGWRERGDSRAIVDREAFGAQASPKGLLKARWDQSKSAVLENRLYRVEIHSVAGDHVTFKWSRENGSVVFPIINHQFREGKDLFIWEDVPGKDNERLISYLSEGLALDWVEGESVQIDKPDDSSTIRIEKDRDWARIVINEEEKTATLTTSDGKRRLLKIGQKNGKHELYEITAIELNLEGLERDRHQLQEGFWVELCDDVTVLSGRSLPLCQVKELDRHNARVTLKAEKDELDQIVDEIDARELQHPLLRRWEGAAGAQDKSWLPLENGIEVAFSDRGTYCVGDYWLIPARTRLEEGIEWPQKKDGEPLPQAPHGIAHHYALLALLRFKEGHWSVLTEESTAFRSLPQITANLSVTDGQLEMAFSRLDKVQETVDTMVGQTHVFAIVKSEKPLEKGDVVSLDLTALERMGANDPGTELPVKLASSEKREGHLVLGVVTEPMDNHRYRITLYGRVCCKVKGPVEPGDMLVTSPESGYAETRRWFHWTRTIIGKALSSTAFDKGKQTDTLDMLVTVGHGIAGPKAPPKKWVAIGIGAVALTLILSVTGWFLRYLKTFHLDIPQAVGGFVTKSPDKARYKHGAKVALTAVPDPNYAFDAWSGDLSGSANPVTLVMDAHKSVTANFDLKPGTVETNSIGMKLVYIPAGSFMMGSPREEAGRTGNEEQHPVTISKGFWMGQTEVTQGQYENVMGENPSHYKEEKCPVEEVTWEAANDFCLKLTKREREEGRLPESCEYRLPTEAEWEYACRAGTTTRFSFGDSDSSLGDYAWFKSNTVDVRKKGAQAVRQMKPNPWGLYDMHGNVFEWCNDWYDKDYYSNSPSVDPMGPSSGDTHSFRGGSWGSPEYNLRCSARHKLDPDITKSDFVGFRVVHKPKTTYSLIVTAVDDFVTKNPDKACYSYGETVTLEAVPDTGYSFVNWSGDLSGTSNPTKITMDANKSVTANFAANTFALTVSATNGSVTTSPDKTSYSYGETVTLQAVPDTGYSFVNWSGDLSGSTNPTTITMDADKSVTANFKSSDQVNNPPPVLQTIGNKSVDENVPLTFKVNAIDPKNEPITYSAQNLPSGSALSNQIFSWTPNYTQAGTYQITFIASDGNSRDSETINIIVSNANRE